MPPGRIQVAVDNGMGPVGFEPAIGMPPFAMRDIYHSYEGIEPSYPAPWLVSAVGLEPTAIYGPKPYAYANSATPTWWR